MNLNLEKYRYAIMGAAAVIAVASVAYNTDSSLPPTQSITAQSRLARVENDVRRDFPAVSQLAPDAFSRLLKTPVEVLAFDVRETSEFDVSHVAGAIRVDPKISREAFLAAYGDDVKGKVVVFYCSVGVRSSRLAERVQDELKTGGSREIHNLSGGVFRWHNEQRTLVNARGQTPLVHGFDRYWRKLVQRQDLTVTSLDDKM